MIDAVELIGGVEVKSGRIINSRKVRFAQERLICNAVCNEVCNQSADC
jgi:hypothetical protein